MKTTNVNCSLCNSSDFKLKFSGNLIDEAQVYEFVGTAANYSKYHNIVECNSCHMVYMNPIDTQFESMTTSVVDDDYIKSKPERVLMFESYLQKILEYKKTGRLLDIGCYAGFFLEQATKAGFICEGVEPSAWASEYAKTLSPSVIHNTSVENFNFKENDFDIITFWDSIEHLYKPQLALESSYKALKKDGMVFITTHDIDSKFAKLLGPKYPWLMRFHFHHYSKKTITAALTKAGFKDIQVTYYKKIFTFKYFRERVGLKLFPDIFDDFRITFSFGDMMFVSAKKI